MAEVVFQDLLQIYRNTRFTSADEGLLTIASLQTIEILTKIGAVERESDEIYDQYQIGVLEDGPLVVGSKVRITVMPPSRSIGFLLPDYAALLKTINEEFKELNNFYVISMDYASSDGEVPDPILSYRSVLGIGAILKEHAAYVDAGQHELVFIGASKTAVPVLVTPADLTSKISEEYDRLDRLFQGTLHGNEKGALLDTAVIDLVAPQLRSQRFGYLLRNLERICDEVEKGYRLFASSFSYSKIRNEVETARVDFLGKIHKTIVDIQGQLLALPIATIVVASQMKAAPACGTPFWTNFSVLLGAWIFVIFLAIAVVNQWHTLSVLGGEIERQKDRLLDDYAAVSDQFIDRFKDLSGRVWWHRAALVVVGAIAFAGASGATIAFATLSTNVIRCFSLSEASTATTVLSHFPLFINY